MSSVVMYAGMFTFQKEGRQGNGYNFVEFTKDNNGVPKGRLQTLYTDSPIDVSKIKAGDIVECEFQTSQFLTGRPKLIGMKTIRSLNII